MALEALKAFSLKSAENEFNLLKIPTDLLSANAFIPQVRDFHLARLPKFLITVKGSQCAYCGKIKDRRTMRIDHIVPMRVYVRLRMLVRGVSSRKYCDMFYRDPDNLVLACQNCNGEKSDYLPDQRNIITRRKSDKYLSAYEAALDVATKGSALEAKILKNLLTYKKISTLDADEKEFVLHGPGSRSTRISGSGSRKVKSLYLKAHRYEPIENRFELMANIHNTVVDRLGIGRPDIAISRAELEDTQPDPSSLATEKERRICLYCLGIFNKSAFQIDHIKSINRPVFGGFENNTANRLKYNDPTNLIAVCQSCNGAKSNSTLTVSWMLAQTKARIEEGLTGIESVLEDDETIEQAIKIRDAIFEFR